MTAPPQIIERALTFHFAPSVNSATGLPDVMEVAVLPLGDASSAPAGATFTGGLRTATVELVYPGPNTAVFDLIPSYTPGLTAPILYRVMWRAGALGRTYTYDFAMPDVDCTWDELITGIGQDKAELICRAASQVDGGDVADKTDLVDRILRRDATEDEIAALADFWETAEAESDQPAHAYGQLTCFAVATMLEALFY